MGTLERARREDPGQDLGEGATGVNDNEPTMELWTVKCARCSFAEEFPDRDAGLVSIAQHEAQGNGHNCWLEDGSEQPRPRGARASKRRWGSLLTGWWPK